MDEFNQKKRTSKGLIALIGVLSLSVVGMGTYIAYDKGYIFGKDTHSSSESDDTTKKTEEVTDNSKVQKEDISISEAIELGQNLWEYAYDTFWGKDTVWKRHTIPGEMGSPIVCDTTANEVKVKFTSDFKATSCPTDGTVTGVECATLTLDDFTSFGCNSPGRGAIQTYIDTTLSVSNISEDEITFVATSNYCNSSWCSNGKVVSSTVSKDFVIKKVNGNWLISNFYIPN